MISEAQRELYHTNGYLLVKNLLEKEFIERLFSTLVCLVVQYGGELAKPYAQFHSWEDDDLSELLIQLRKQDKKRFSAIYEAATKSFALNNVCHNNEITQYICAILGITPSYLSTQSIFLRMDPPFDRRNVYDWHQDGSYNLHNHRENSIVTWMPMTHTDANNGSLKICQFSHNEGLIPVVPSKPVREGSTQR